MAHSIQKGSGKTEVVNDLDLLVIIGFALKLARELPHRDELQKLLMQWRDQLRHYGPGVIDLKLEHLDRTPETAAQLRELLAAILAHISQYHETIPAKVLNEQLSVPGVTFSDYRVEYIETSVKKLQALISRS